MTFRTLLFQTVKVIILVLIIIVLLRQFRSASVSGDTLWLSLKAIFQRKEGMVFLIPVVLLMIINWAIEAVKWQKLTFSIEMKSFADSFKGVLMGLAAGIVTPLMLGDFWGRAILFEGKRKQESIGVNLFNSITQTLAAILMGALSLLLLALFFPDRMNPLMYVLTGLLFTASLLGSLLLVRNSWHKYLPSFARKYFLSLADLDRSLVTETIGLSLLRNLVFGLQFILIYKAFGLNSGFLPLFIGVNLIFLAKTVAGGLNVVGDLSLRELTALYFFGRFETDMAAVAMATLLMWALNIFIPAVAGALLIIQFKPGTRHV